MSTEELILKKTFALLLRKGFDATSITDIQKATGLSRGLLYHYFRNKEELFIQVTEKYFIQIFDFDVRKTKDCTATGFVEFLCNRFKRIHKTIADIVDDSEKSKISMLNYHFLFYQVMQRDTIFRNNYRITTEKELTAWVFALNNSLAKSEIRHDANIDAAAKQLFTLTDGIWFQSIFSPDGESIIKSLEAALLHYIALLK